MAWEITVDPKAGTLGLEGLRRREFTEYYPDIDSEDIRACLRYTATL